MAEYTQRPNRAHPAISVSSQALQIEKFYLMQKIPQRELTEDRAWWNLPSRIPLCFDFNFNYDSWTNNVISHSIVKHAQFNSSLKSKSIIFLQPFKPGKCKPLTAWFLRGQLASENLISEVAL